MDPVQITSLLKDYGPWGALGLCLWALRWMFGKYDGVQEARIADGREQTKALQASTAALDSSARLTANLEAKVSLLADRLDRPRSTL